MPTTFLKFTALTNNHFYLRVDNIVSLDTHKENADHTVITIENGAAFTCREAISSAMARLRKALKGELIEEPAE